MTAENDNDSLENEELPPLRALLCPVTSFQQNCTLIWCTETKKAAFVDPGGDVDRLLEVAEQNGVELEKILITHGHIDHAGGAAELSEKAGIPIEGPHKDDSFWIDTIEEDGPKWGLPDARKFSPDRWLEDGDHVTLGKLTFLVRHCPGHTPGHIIFFNQPTMLASVGDVLFQGSIGRTDFPRGDHGTLIQSITEKLWPLGNEVTFIPGHGQISTFGHERQSNPFVADQVLGQNGR